MTFKMIKQIARKLIELCSGANALDKFRVSTRAPAMATDRPRKSKPDRLLAPNENKTARERLTLPRLFEELFGLGHDSAHEAVRRYDAYGASPMRRHR